MNELRPEMMTAAVCVQSALLISQVARSFVASTCTKERLLQPYLAQGEVGSQEVVVMSSLA